VDGRRDHRAWRGGADDDATAVLVEWRRGTERSLVPQTV
jgi:hypothetical protein